MRSETKKIKIGGIEIGGGAPVAVQSMTITDTRDAEATIAQIKRLEAAGCEIIRCAVLDTAAAKALAEIKRNISIPLVADIHYDYRLALEAVNSGVDKLRINPGNTPHEHLREIVSAATDRNIPIRVGINSGSLEKDILKRFGRTPEGLCESALRSVSRLEAMNFTDIAISIKSANPAETYTGYKLLAERTSYPLHLGVTEAGGAYAGGINSAVAIGGLLLAGIGDTIRVSLTADPEEEVRCAKQILTAAGLRSFGATVISCPTCGRTQVDLIPLAARVEKYAETLRKPIKVAVMGCSVNGLGEAAGADIGIACGKGEGVIFRSGKAIRKVAESELFDELVKEVELMY